MPASCSAPGCQNRRDKKRPELVFKTIPSDERLNKLWKSNMKRKNYPKDHNIVLCWEHFESDCFERDFESEFKHESTKELFKIKNDAVPTIFSHVKDVPRRTSSEKRATKATKRKLVDDLCQQPTTSRSTSISATLSLSNTEEEIIVSDTPAVMMCSTAMNTDLSFSPRVDVTFNVACANITVSPTTEDDVNTDNESDIDIDSSSCESDTESEYRPSDVSDESDSDFSDCEENSARFRNENSNAEDGGMKFITFFSSLLVLLRFCLICDLPAKIEQVFTRGTALCVKLICRAGHKSSWCSQPEINHIYLGNLLTAASIVFGGGTFSQFQSIASALKLQIMSERSFFSLQRKYVYPSINYTYKLYQKCVLDECKDKESIEVSGDGRCDSPGYNAKYGTYSIMDQLTSKILHFRVVTAKETTSSNAMELHALKKVLEKLSELGIAINCITTDDHPSIKKYLKSAKKPPHQLDSWHKGKNIKKKLTKAAKKKSCRDLQGWIKSIVNHFWWSVSTCEGNESMLMEKWTSILYHVSNIHEFSDNKYFTKCNHAEIGERVWITPGSPAHNALKSIIKEKRLLGDLKYFTKFKHTGNLEVFHSVLLKYCPKRLHFSHIGMISRTQLAVLHFNGTINSKQAVTKEGIPRYKLQFSRVTQSMVVKPIKCVNEMKFIDDLKSNMLQSLKTGEKYTLPKVPVFQVDKPNKADAILRHRSRFSKPS